MIRTIVISGRLGRASLSRHDDSIDALRYVMSAMSAWRDRRCNQIERCSIRTITRHLARAMGRDLDWTHRYVRALEKRRRWTRRQAAIECLRLNLLT